jgi:hypothetical protein
MKVAVHALDLEAVFGDGVAVGAARNKKDIVTCGGESGAKITADRTGGHRCNTHVFVPVWNWKVYPALPTVHKRAKKLARLWPGQCGENRGIAQ